MADHQKEIMVLNETGIVHHWRNYNNLDHTGTFDVAGRLY